MLAMSRTNAAGRSMDFWSTGVGDNTTVAPASSKRGTRGPSVGRVTVTAWPRRASSATESSITRSEP